MIGKIVGRLTVIEKLPNKRLLVSCSCGVIKEVSEAHVRYERIKSCGCIRREQVAKRNNIHGLSKHPLRTTFSNMKGRCYNPGNDRYYRYGLRGISVCDEWKDNFKAFYDWAMQNGWKPGLTLEREKIDENYSPNNCSWIAANLQQKNTSRSRIVEYNGETRTISDWADHLGIFRQTLFARINIYKWPIKRAFTEAVRCH